MFVRIDYIVMIKNDIHRLASQSAMALIAKKLNLNISLYFNLYNG